MSDGQVNGIKLEKIMGSGGWKEDSAFRETLLPKTKSHTWKTDAKRGKRSVKKHLEASKEYFVG